MHPCLGHKAKTPATPSRLHLNTSPEYIARRIEREEADGGGELVELGLSRTDIARLGIHRINLVRKPDEPSIELHQQLTVTVTAVSVQNWTRGRTVIVDGTAEIVKFIPKFYVRVDGISATDCRNLKYKFGPEFPALIAANPSFLAKSRYSKEKRDIITKACQREILARKNDTANTANLIAALCACGATKTKARKLAEVYDAALSPYQFFFRGRLTFLQADRFARLIDPERAAEDRTFLFIIDQFIRSQHIIVTQRNIRETVWNDFGVEWSSVDDEIERLVDLGIVRKIERKGAAPAFIAIDARVSTEAFGNGVIVSQARGTVRTVRRQI